MGEGSPLFRRQLPTSLFFLQPLEHFPALPQLSSIQFQKVRYQLDQPFEVKSLFSSVIFVLGYSGDTGIPGTQYPLFPNT
jgi:hypothetical protein